jgi:HSP20 family protein
MALIRWEPARELATIQTEMNRLFNTFFEPASGANGTSNTGSRRWIPAMDLVEAEDNFVLRADLPGLSESDVNIERASGAFSRSLTLPEGVDPEAVQASFDRGVLEVRIPKPEQRKPRKVTISAGGAGQGTIEGSESTGSSS